MPEAIAKTWSSVFGWFIGALLFAVLSPAAVLLRWKEYWGPHKGVESHGKVFYPADLKVGVLPNEINEEISYAVPPAIPETATAILVEASIPVHNEAETRDYELYSDSTSANPLCFYLFTKPFSSDQGLSYNTFSSWVELTPDRRLSLRLAGRSKILSSNRLDGEMTIVGYR